MQYRGTGATRSSLTRYSQRLCILIVIISCSVGTLVAANDTEATQIVAKVGDCEIKFQDYLARYEDYLIWTGLQDNKQARFAILNNMINEVLLRNFDDNSGIYNNPEYKREVGSAWKSTVLAFVKDQEVYAKITASDRELRTAYVRSKMKVAVRHLYARTKKDADNLYKLVSMGISFDELAKQVFTDTTLRNHGGYLGYINWGETDPEFENAAYSMNVGDVSRPVKTAQGYSIIRVEDKIEDPFLTETEFLNLRHKLERAVRIEKKKPSENAFLERVFDQKKVTFHENVLVAVLNDLNGPAANIVESNTRNPRGTTQCVEYKGKKYSAKEIEAKLLETPDYNRRLVTTVKLLKEAVLGLVMQDVLLDIAKAKGYDTTSYVHESFDKLANDIYLNYKRNEVLALVPVADSEITKYYTDNLAYYTSEREINVQEIVVGSDSVASVVKQKIERGEDFGSLARNYSLRTWSAKNGGVMGLAPASKFGGMKDTLWDSPVGTVIGPLPFDKYYGFFRVVEKKEGTPIAISGVRDQIVKAIKNEKGFPYMKQRLSALTEKTTVTVHEELVKNYTMNVAGK